MAINQVPTSYYISLFEQKTIFETSRGRLLYSRRVQRSNIYDIANRSMRRFRRGRHVAEMLERGWRCSFFIDGVVLGTLLFSIVSTVVLRFGVCCSCCCSYCIADVCDLVIEALTVSLSYCQPVVRCLFSILFFVRYRVSIWKWTLGYHRLRALVGLALFTLFSISDIIISGLKFLRTVWCSHIIEW